MNTMTFAGILVIIAIGLVIAGILWNIFLHRSILRSASGKEKTQANIAIWIVAAGIFTGLLCFAVGIFTMSQFNMSGAALPASSLEKSMFDMQTITLAVTALAVAMVSLIGGVLSLHREQKLEKYEDKVQDLLKESREHLDRYDSKIRDMLSQSEADLKNTLAKMEESAARRQDINAINALDKSVRHLPIKEKLLLEREREFGEERHLLIGLIDFYVSKAGQMKTSLDMKTEAYLAAEKYAKQLLSLENAQAYDRVFAMQQLADINYQLARLSNNHQQTEAMDRLKKAEHYLLEIGSDRDVDAYGHLSNQLGLVYYWMYNIDREKNRDYLAKSKEPYLRAIERFPESGRYYRNLGVTILNQAGHSSNKKQKVELIHRAKEYFQKCARFDTTDALAFVNIADTCIQLLAIHLDVGMMNYLLSRDYDEKVKNGFVKSTCSAKHCENVEALIREAQENLQQAKRIGPMEINVHYKYGQLLTLKYHYCRLMNHGEYCLREIKRDAMDAFTHAKTIEDKHLGTLFCLRNFYECIEDFDEAIKVSEQIRKLQNRDEDKWRMALADYLESRNNTDDEPDNE